MTEALVNGGRNYRLTEIRPTVVVTLINLAICWKLFKNYSVLVSIGSSQNLIDKETISRKDLSKTELKSRKMFNPKKIPSDIGNYIAGFTDGEGSLMFLFDFEKIIKSLGKSL